MDYCIIPSRAGSFGIELGSTEVNFAVARHSVQNKRRAVSCRAKYMFLARL